MPKTLRPTKRLIISFIFYPRNNLIYKKNNFYTKRKLQVKGALLKLGNAAVFMKVIATLFVNFFTISIEGYYTICATILNVKFSILMHIKVGAKIKVDLTYSTFEFSSNNLKVSIKAYFALSKLV